MCKKKICPGFEVQGKGDFFGKFYVLIILQPLGVLDRSTALYFEEVEIPKDMRSELEDDDELK